MLSTELTARGRNDNAFFEKFSAKTPVFVVFGILINQFSQFSAKTKENENKNSGQGRKRKKTKTILMIMKTDLSFIIFLFSIYPLGSYHLRQNDEPRET